jgi:hypothetical protein
MRIPSSFVFVIPIFAVVSLFAAGPDGPAQIKLEEVLSIGGPDADLLFQWTGVSVDRDDQIFVVDTLDYSLKKFDPRGRLLGKVGRKGQGPGEFEKAVGVSVVGDSVYAWDLSVRAVQVFDRNLVYRKSLPLPGLVDGLGPAPDGALAVGILGPDGSPKIIVIDAEGNIVREIAYQEKEDRFFGDSVRFVVGPSREIYIGYLFRDLVEKRDSSGARIWAKNPWGAKSVSLREIRGFKIPTESCVLSVARDSRGRIYVLGGKKAPHPARDVVVYDSDGTPAGGFLLPEASHSLYFDHRDFLYVAADGGVTLKKYRLIIKAPSRNSADRSPLRNSQWSARDRSHGCQFVELP